MGMSFQSPNYTQTPNDLFDDMLKEIDDLSELKVTLAAIRQTFGYHREKAEMSLGWFELVTGLARHSVQRGIEKAIERGTIAKVKDATNRTGAIYSVVILEGQPVTPRGAASDPLGGQPQPPLKKERKNKEVAPPIVANGETPIDQPSPAEKLVEQTIFGLGWQERMEIREMAEKDVGLVSLTQALQEFREKVAAGKYPASFPMLRKFWNNVMSTNTLRAPAVMTEMPEYQRNIRWAQP
jgi:hypothetical protein